MPGQVRHTGKPIENGAFRAVLETMTDKTVKVRITRINGGTTILRLDLDDLFDLTELLDDVCDGIEDGR